ncbi:MAG: hypothetical protein ACJAYB_001884 [Psychromonas sp.]|jgi:hypothetical protein
MQGLTINTFFSLLIVDKQLTITAPESYMHTKLNT